ncbi:MAG: hypothetical protein ABEH56_03680 [Salinirussus sp.]
MPFSGSWHALLEELDGPSGGAELVTPLSHDRVRVTEVQKHRVVVTSTETGDRTPLQRDQFETLSRRIREADGGFDLDRLPPDADPYPAVLSLHPRFEIDEQAGIITEREGTTATQPASDEGDAGEAERVEPGGLDVYSDALLLVDALERHDVSDLSGLETNALVNLYTLCSDVQRNADEFRKDVASVLLDRVHHDRPVHGQYGSVQRTTRRNRSLRDDEEVLAVLEAEGIDRERVTSVDSTRVDEALAVTELPESSVYEIDESEYVRKAAVDEETKQSRLQGLKDRLAASDGEATDGLQREIEELEDRIDDLTSFSTASLQ